MDLQKLVNVVLNCTLREFLEDYSEAGRILGWFVSPGHPTGTDLILDDPDYCFPEAWLTLGGRIDPNTGRWCWDGKGSPVDERSNSVLRLEAYLGTDADANAIAASQE